MDLKIRFTLFLSALWLILMSAFSVVVYNQVKTRLIKGAESTLVGHVEHDTHHLSDRRAGKPEAPPMHASSIFLRIWKNGDLVEDSFPKDAAVFEALRRDGLFHRKEVQAGKNNFLILGYYDLTRTFEYLGELRNVLYVSFLLGLALVLPSGFFLAKILLRPFRTLSQTAAHLDAAHLNFRLEEPKPLDEYGLLTRTLNRLLDRLEKSFGQLSRFATNASHELRTPIAVILAQAEMALRKKRSPEELEEILGKIVDKAKHLDGITHHLLSLSNLERVRVLAAEEVPLRELIETHLVTLDLRGKTVDLSGIPKELIWRGNAELLGIMLSNLIDNAVKYGTSKVRIEAYINEEGLSLRVEDDGPGVPESLRENIFEPFFRGHGQERAVLGHGIGLSIVRACASALRGNVLVKNSSLGGAFFQVDLLTPT